MFGRARRNLGGQIHTQIESASDRVESIRSQPVNAATLGFPIFGAGSGGFVTQVVPAMGDSGLSWETIAIIVFAIAMILQLLVIVFFAWEPQQGRRKFGQLTVASIFTSFSPTFAAIAVARGSDPMTLVPGL